MKRALLVFTLILITAGCSKTPLEKIDSLFEDGMQALEEMDYQKASESFEAIKEIDSLSIKGIYGTARLHEQRLQFFDALNLYLKLYESEIDQFNSIERAYDIVYHLGFYDDALDLATMDKRSNPTKTKAVLNEAKALTALGYYSEARDILSQQDSENDIVKIMTASTFAYQGQFDSASFYAGDIISKSSSDPDLLRAISDYYEADGQIDKALSVSGEMTALDKADHALEFEHFFRLVDNHYFDDARHIISEYENNYNDTLTNLGLKFDYLLEYGDKIQLKILMNEYFILKDKSLSRQLYFLEAHMEANDKFSAQKTYEKIKFDKLNDGFTEWFSNFLKYYAFTKFNKYDKVYASIEDTEMFPPERKSQRDYQLEITLTKYTTGLFDEAKDELRKYEYDHADDITWLTGTAKVYTNQGVRIMDRGERLFKQVLENNPYYLPAFFGYVKRYYVTDEIDKAVELFDQYNYLVEKYPYVAMRYAKTLADAGQLDKSVEVFSANYPNLPGDLTFARGIITQLKKNNRSDLFNKMIAALSGPSATSSALALSADCYNELGNYSEALAAADKAIALEDELPDGHVQKARATFLLGNKTEAFDQFEANMERFTDNAENLYYYSRYLSEEGIDPLRTQNLARRASFASYASPRFALNLSYVYYNTGRADLAFGEARKAAKVDYKNGDAFYMVGLTGSQLDRDDIGEELVLAYERAIELGVTPEKEKAARKYLEEHK